MSSAAPSKEELMESLYRYGITLEEIGRLFSLSRERIRQILATRGVRAEVGGAAVRSARAAEARWLLKRAAKDERCRKFYGCDYETVLKINSGRNLSCSHSPAYAYTQQRKSAAMRGIAWNFTLPTWWAVWERSGMWGLRGTRKVSYCMARVNDSGAYAPDNVQVISCSQNASDSYKTKPAWMRRQLRSPESLSPRQKEVAALAARGLEPKDIAAHLKITPQTVMVHLASIKQKSGAYAHFYEKAAA